MQKTADVLQRINRLTHALEGVLLVTILLSMIVLAVVQIVIRNGFDTGLVWSDASVRIMVLWVMFLGAMIASRKNRHISINLVDQYFSKKKRQVISRFTNLVTAAVCFYVAYIGYRFVKMEYEEGIIAFSAVPAWVCELIIPVGFAVIGLRYFANVFASIEELRQ